MFQRLRTWVLRAVVRAERRGRTDPRRRTKLRAAPTPETWLEIVTQEIRQFRRLDPDRRAKFLGDLQVFVGEKEIVGIDDFVVDDRIRVMIGASAALLVSGLDIARFDHVGRIEIHGTRQQEAGKECGGRYRHGTIGGEPIGTVELVWHHVVDGMAADDGSNVALHELAHALDHGDGAADALVDHPRYATWCKALDRFPIGRRVMGRRRYVVADVSGPELFAAATELFFERPAALRQLDPTLFDALRDHYQIDPHELV